MTVNPAPANQVTCSIEDGTGKINKGLPTGPLGAAAKKVTITVKLTGNLRLCADGYGNIVLPKGPITDGTFKVSLKSVTNVSDNGPSCAGLNQLGGKSSLKYQKQTQPSPPKYATVATEKANLTSGGPVNLSTNTFGLSGLSATTKAPFAGQTETVQVNISPSTATDCASGTGLKTFTWSGTYNIG